MSDSELKGKRSDGWQLLGGLVVGYLTATLLVSVPLTSLGWLLGEYGDRNALLTVLLLLTLAFGAADILGRTPNVNRQVPQRFVRDVTPLPRGLLWGFDLGLLVTTQKTASLLWVAVLGAVLVGPDQAIFPTLLAAATVYLGGVTILSIRGTSHVTDLDFGRLLLPSVRLGSGLVLVGLAVVGLSM